MYRIRRSAYSAHMRCVHSTIHAMIRYTATKCTRKSVLPFSMLPMVNLVNSSTTPVDELPLSTTSPCRFTGRITPITSTVTGR